MNWILFLRKVTLLTVVQKLVEIVCYSLLWRNNLSATTEKKTPEQHPDTIFLLQLQYFSSFIFLKWNPTILSFNKNNLHSMMNVAIFTHLLIQAGKHMVDSVHRLHFDPSMTKFRSPGKRKWKKTCKKISKEKWQSLQM